MTTESKHPCHTNTNAHNNNQHRTSKWHLGTNPQYPPLPVGRLLVGCILAGICPVIFELRTVPRAVGQRKPPRGFPGYLCACARGWMWRPRYLRRVVERAAHPKRAREPRHNQAKKRGAKKSGGREGATRPGPEAGFGATEGPRGGCLAVTTVAKVLVETSEVSDDFVQLLLQLIIAVHMVDLP